MKDCPGLDKRNQKQLLPWSFSALVTKLLSGGSQVEALICHVNYTQTECSWTFLATFLKLRRTHPLPGGSYKDKVESKKANPKHTHRKESHSLHFSLFNH